MRRLRKLEKVLRFQLDTTLDSEAQKRCLVPRWDQPTGAAALLRQTPPDHGRRMHTQHSRYRAIAAEFADDTLCSIHGRGNDALFASYCQPPSADAVARFARDTTCEIRTMRGAMKLHEWLRMKFKESGISTRKAAEVLGKHQSNISRMLKGEAQIKARDLRALASLIGEPIPQELVPTSPDTVPVMGYVGAGAEVYPPDEDQELDRVEAPSRATKRLAAVVVRGDSMEPEFHDGDVIFYEEPNSYDPEKLVGRTVVVRTEDGRTFVKRLLRGSKPGLWDLESHAAPPMRDARIAWVAPIRYIKKAEP